MSKLTTLRTHARRHGWLSALHLLVFQPLEDMKILRVGEVVVTETVGVLPELPPDCADIEGRLLDEVEIRQLAARESDWFFPGAVERSLERGEACFGAFIRNEPVTTIWYSERPLLQFGLLLQPREDMVFAHRRFTRRAWRGRNIAAWAGIRAAEWLRSRGIRYTIGTIYWTNASSLAQTRKRGGRRVGYIVQLGPDAWNTSFLLRYDPLCPTSGPSTP